MDDEVRVTLVGANHHEPVEDIHNRIPDEKYDVVLHEDIDTLGSLSLAAVRGLVSRPSASLVWLVIGLFRLPSSLGPLEKRYHADRLVARDRADENNVTPTPIDLPPLQLISSFGDEPISEKMYDYAVLAGTLYLLLHPSRIVQGSEFFYSLRLTSSSSMHTRTCETGTSLIISPNIPVMCWL